MTPMLTANARQRLRRSMKNNRTNNSSDPIEKFVLIPTGRGVAEIAPLDLGERRAFAGARDNDRAERHHQPEYELGQHAGAGRGERAERQIAAHGENERAGSDEHAAGDMISTDHTLTGTLVVRACGHPHTLPMAWTAASTRLASSSQNLAKSGLSR